MSYKATLKYPLCVKYTIRKEVYKLLKYGFIGDWSNTRNKTAPILETANS